MDLPQDLGDVLITIGIRLLGVALVLIIGRALAGLTKRWMTRYLRKTGLTPSLVTLIVMLSYYGIILLAVMVALGVLGVPATAIVTVSGIVVVVLAIALQQSLGNLAATINFLLFKPFEVGDLIETAGMVGVVNEIQMFSTVLDAADNKTHVLPNSKIQGSGLTNITKKGSVRVDLSFRISYENNIEQAKQLLEDLLVEDSRVLSEPFPYVFVSQLAESHVELKAWPFVSNKDYGLFNTGISENVKKAFDSAGVIIPRPQHDVHLVGDRA